MCLQSPVGLVRPASPSLTQSPLPQPHQPSLQPLSDHVLIFLPVWSLYIVLPLPPNVHLKMLCILSGVAFMAYQGRWYLVFPLQRKKQRLRGVTLQNQQYGARPQTQSVSRLRVFSRTPSFCPTACPLMLSSEKRIPGWGGWGRWPPIPTQGEETGSLRRPFWQWYQEPQKYAHCWPGFSVSRD